MMSKAYLRKFAVLVALMPAAVGAEPPSVEITQLFNVLEMSGCQFSRNGSWYDSAKAREHLQRKYDYVVKRQPDLSAEKLIELVATKSSVTGQPYWVRCGQAEPVESRRWLMDKLQERRQSAHS